MDTTTHLIAAREKGEVIPLSIGTAQAVEALCGVGEFHLKEPPLYAFREVWVNLRTLFRNFFNSISRESQILISGEDLVVGLVEDWLLLKSSIQQASQGQTTVVLYHCSMKGFEKTFPNAKYKTLSTEKQKSEQRKEDATVEAFFEQYGEEVLECNVKLTGNHAKTAILTHYPVDLLWYRTFRDLTLVESHTGRFKTRADWHTKLTGGKKLSHIPFNKMTIQLFGDGNVVFASMILSLKNAVVTLAQENRWHSLTTNEKVRHDLDKLYDPTAKNLLKAML